MIQIWLWGIRGGSKPPLKKSPQLVWNLQLPQKAIHNVKFLEPINNHIFHYKYWLYSIVFYIWWCISIKTVDLRLCYYFLPPQYLSYLNSSDHLIIHIGYSYYYKVKSFSRINPFKIPLHRFNSEPPTTK